MQELEEGEVPAQKGTKKHKTAKDPKDKRSTSMDSREEQTLAEVCLQQHTWFPRLEVERVPIPWNAPIREYQRGHSQYVAEALKQLLILPKDMDAVRKLKQQDLFNVPKKGLCPGKPSAMHFICCITNKFLFFFFWFTWSCHVVLVQITQEVYVAEE